MFNGTTILINGAKGDFYRVFLSDKTTAWISQKDVTIYEDKKLEPAQFVTTTNKTYKNAIVQTISFTKNLPYTIEERDKDIVFKVYNAELSGEAVYTLNIPKPPKYKYTVSLQNGLYTVKVSELPLKISEWTVVIDAGHGGSENGALGCLGDCEKDINLKVALELERKLATLGVKTVLTRACDANMSLVDRVQLAKQNDAEIFISIHLNSIPDIKLNICKNKGTSVYFYNNNSKELATILHKNITKTLGTRQDGVTGASFAVIRPSDYVGVLVELAYMINPSDSLLYTSSNFSERAADGIIQGLLEYAND